MKWDKMLEKSSQVPVIPGKRTFGMFYLKNKGQYNIESRDFFEKGFNFYSNGRFYRYSTSVPNSEQFKEKQPGTTRGATYYNCGMMERDPKTRKVLLTTITQCDFFIPIPSFIVTTFLPNKTKEWKQNVTKYYQVNAKNGNL